MEPVSPPISSAPCGGGTFPTLPLHHESGADRFLEWGSLVGPVRGYATVVQDCRGCYRSEGTFHAYLNEGADTHDTLDWIANEPWSNGKIGTWGRSYGGVYQWLTAPLDSPHLTRMAPMSSADNYFRRLSLRWRGVPAALSALGR